MAAMTIPSRVRPLPASTSAEQTPQSPRHVHIAAWLVLAAALVVINVFAYQVALVPQARDYHPDWHGARWVGVAGSSASVGYFRKTVTLLAAPESAFVAVQGWQTFALYINGQAVDTTRDDFTSGAVNLAYDYDVTPLLRVGANTIALRVVNQDQGNAAARIVLGVSAGRQLVTFPSDSSWLATADTALARPFHVANNADWRTNGFDAGAWRQAAPLATAPTQNGIVRVDPAVYATPLPLTGIAASAADGFFYHSMTLPQFATAWLRVATTGSAQIYLNGRLLTAQPAHLAASAGQTAFPARATLLAGIYDVTPYLHAGANDIAVHVTAATLPTQNKLAPNQTPPAALVGDILTTNAVGTPTTSSINASWQAATSAGAGWTHGDSTARWQAATPLAVSSLLGAAPYRVIATDRESGDLWQSVVAIAITTLLFILVCFAALLVANRPHWRDISVVSVERLALAFAPMLGLATLLGVLSCEPLLPHPFPYTPFWLCALIVVALIGGAVVFAIAHVSAAGGDATPPQPLPILEKWGGALGRLRRQSFPLPIHQHGESPRRPTGGSKAQLCGAGDSEVRGWGTLSRRITAQISSTTIIVAALVLLGLGMAVYQLGYENFWQDEVTSVVAAQGILHSGLPRLLSGFIYTKAELFSYMLAGIMVFFGPDPVALRLLSVVEYGASLVLTYIAGRYFFGKRVGVLATALLVFSPLALRWGREARMYQQAELCILIVAWLFYLALQPQARPRSIYLSMAAVVVMYLSHEETFIVLPALLLYFLATQRLTWVRNLHWWTAGLTAMAIILFQLYLAQVTHPPILGTDQTEQPLIAFSPDNIGYYLRVFFAPGSLGSGVHPALGFTVALASAAGVGALFTRHRPLRYLSCLLFVSLGCLMTIFSLTADRYVYPLLPLIVLLAAAAVVWSSERISLFARQRLAPVAAQMIVAITVALVVAVVLLAQTAPLANFGLATSRVLGVPYHHIYPDYQAAGNYIRAHWEPGDVLVTIAPAIDGAFYAERPAFLIYQDKALYLIEQNGHIVDTPTGSTVLLNEQDVNAMLATYHRVWVLAADGYACCGDKGEAPIGRNFALVFEGQSTSVYLRGG